MSFYAAGRVAQRSFKELQADVGETVERLRSWGLRPRMRVGILASNSYAWVVHDLALIELECVAVAFPEAFALRSRGELIERYDLALLLLGAQDDLAREPLPAAAAFLDAVERRPALRSAAGEAIPADTHSLIFSSGTNGRVKGLIVNDRGAEACVRAFYRSFELHTADRLLVFLPLSHYQQRLCAYTCLFYGIDLALVCPGELMNALRDMQPTLCLAPPLFFETLEQQFRTAVGQLPAARRALVGVLEKLADPGAPELLRRLAQRLCYARIRAALGGRMRLMWTGMAPIKRSALLFFERVGLPVYEAYGLTECGVIAANTAAQRRIGSVGKPVEPDSVFLADDGEVIVRNPDLMTRGYFDVDPAEEAGVYVDSRTLRTGDLGRFDADGFLHLIGRKKAILITSQGVKVQPEPLEAQLERCPAIERACVFGSGLPQLVALVVLRAPADEAAKAAAEAAVRELNQGLDTSAQVRRMVFTAERPSLENGWLTRSLKLDRDAIYRRFEAEFGGAEARARGAAQASETERKLAGIWAEVLGTHDIAPGDSFFERGGDSIRATQVLSRIRSEFGLELPFRALFQAVRLGELACMLDELQGRGAPVSGAIARAPREGGLPLSFAQQRLWLLQELDRGSTAYNVAGAARLRGALDRQALAAGLGEVVRRHEVLRTSFAAGESGPFQVIRAAQPVPLPELDCSGLDERAQQAEIARLARAEARKPFDLRRDPLVRASLLRLREDEHLLLLTFHHVAADGWSLAVFLREIAALYAARAAGAASPLPELAIQYADFAVWQRRALQGEVVERELAYWRRQLRGAPRLLPLPTDWPRPALRAGVGAVASVELDAALCEALQVLAARQGATLFMALLAAFAVLLGRAANAADLAIGSPIAGRNRAETEDLIGCFVNTLVLRVRLDADASFRRLLDRVRELTLDAYSHQELPFERLVEELAPERSLAHTPLFQVMFVYQNAPEVRMELGGLRVEPVALHGGTSKCDLILEVTNEGGALRASMEYDTALFAPQTVELMLKKYRGLLGEIATDADRAISEYSAEAGERSAAAAGAAEADTLHGRFEAQARLRPAAVALIQGAEALSYGALNRQANRVAWRLRALGIGPENLVGLCAERSFELLVGLLGILKAGAAYVPLDPASPKQRLALMLGGVRAMVVGTSVTAVLPEHGQPLVEIGECQASRELSEENPPLRGSAGQLAYVIYTSGSTGQPKGVMVTHANVCRLFDRTQPWFHIDERDVWLLFHSFAFDFSVWEIFGALLHGGRLVVAPFWLSRSPAELIEVAEEAGITVLNQTPSAFRQWVAADQQRSKPAPSALRLIIFGGEALDFASLRPWFQRHGDQRPALVNMYGITETCVHVTYRPVGARDAEQARGSLIGQPIPDLELHLLGDDGLPVAPGQPGEICVGGAGVARGYWEQPALTAERFVPDATSGRAGARLYRSGDLGVRLPDGELQYLGRIDSQVKIRGFRVETREIEVLLDEQPAVQQSAVLSYEAAPGDTRLVAYVVPDAKRAHPIRQALRLEREGRVGARGLHALPNGLSVFHLNRAETDFLYEEIFASRSYAKHGIELQPGDCVFDVGANIGISALYFALQHPGVRVYAFEPIRSIFDVLRLNLELYGIEAHSECVGLSDRSGQAQFTYYPNCSVISGEFADRAAEVATVKTFLVNENRARAGGELADAVLDAVLAQQLQSETCVCELRTVSQIIREQRIERIDLLKIDVEKGEANVLAGIDAADWPRIRQLVVEVHDLDGRVEQLRKLLVERGFEVELERDANLEGTQLYNLYAVRGGAARSAAAQGSPVLPWSNRASLASTLRAALRERVPEYMVPATCMFVEAIPLTVNGKLDRAALPSPQARDADLPLGGEPPASETERSLAAIWSDVLQLREQGGEVGQQSNFFELGGHSLLATQVAARVAARLGVELPLRAVFELRTLAALAEQIDTLRWLSQGAPEAGAVAGDVEEGEL